MNEIRTTKIDGVEFVTYKDYLRLKEENKKLQEEIKNNKKNIMQDELEIIPKLEEENKNLKEEIKEIEKNQEYRYNRCMKAENEKLKAMLEE